MKQQTQKKIQAPYVFDTRKLKYFITQEALQKAGGTLEGWVKMTGHNGKNIPWGTIKISEKDMEDARKQFSTSE